MRKLHLGDGCTLPMYFLMKLCEQKHRQVERPADTGSSWSQDSPVCQVAVDSKRCCWSKAWASLEGGASHRVACRRQKTEATSSAAQRCPSPLVCEPSSPTIHSSSAFTLYLSVAQPGISRENTEETS